MTGAEQLAAKRRWVETKTVPLRISQQSATEWFTARNRWN